MYLFSQTFDVDIKLRNLTDSMYLLKCHMGWLSVGMYVNIIVLAPNRDSKKGSNSKLSAIRLSESPVGCTRTISRFILRATESQPM